MFHAVHEDDSGTPDGYVTYRIKEGDGEGDNTLFLSEVISVDADVEAALYQFAFDVDLTDKFVLRFEPVDSPLPWRLRDQRAYHAMGVWDFLWVRVLDTAAALSARRYAGEGSIVIEVVDAFRPDGAAAGRFRLDGGPDGATCAADNGADADITTTVDALGSAYLGGVRWTTLAGAGRVSGTPEALQRADAMFASTPLPFCNTGF
jgi:predicted acetyltransferase